MTDPSPSPIDTSQVTIPEELRSLVERLSEHIHNRWAEQKTAQGWTYGPSLDEATRHHPSLVPYADLPESEKDLDRTTVQETIKSILALGYQIGLD